MEGSATFTIETSRTTMNWATQATASTTHCGYRGAGGWGPGAVIPPVCSAGDPAVAGAAATGCRVRSVVGRSPAVDGVAAVGCQRDRHPADVLAHRRWPPGAGRLCRPGWTSLLSRQRRQTAGGHRAE